MLDTQLASQLHAPQADDSSDCNGFPAGFRDDYNDSDLGSDSSDDSGSDKINHKYALKLLKSRSSGGDGILPEEEEAGWKCVIDDTTPPSFSQVDLSRPAQELHACFPLFPVSFLHYLGYR